MADEKMIITPDMTLERMLGTDCTIEIPIIQRDYAQGRKNAEEIRKNFLKDIFDHIEKNEKMKLSFVYGTKKGNTYEPYDGQQRLTLVYLLTLYLSAYCKDWDRVKSLSRFTYYTRDYATDFCKFLTGFDSYFDEKNVFQRIPVNEVKNISDRIKQDAAFLRVWQYEPTVYSMLEVLKSIQDEFERRCSSLTTADKDKKANDYLQYIVNGEVFFDWCQINANDNIYIKMNGRGKPLSTFDNFKNTLFVELEKLRAYALNHGETAKVDFLKNFENKMDGEWTELFWELREHLGGAGNYDIAPYMMNFLFTLFEIRHCVSTNGFYFGGKEAFRWINEKNVLSFLAKFRKSCMLSEKGEPGTITLDDYIWVSKIMDILAKRLNPKNAVNLTFQVNEYGSELDVFLQLLSHKDDIASSKLAMVASLYYLYLVRISEFDGAGLYRGLDTTYREQWITLLNNLIETAAAFKGRYDALLRDKHIITGFEKIFLPKAFEGSKSGDLIAASIKFDNSTMIALKDYFDASHVYSQLIEEIVKYKLQNINKSIWEPLLKQAETDLPYFRRMIYFLIAMSEDAGYNVSSQSFSDYLNAIKMVIDSNGVVEKYQNEFSAILLYYADYRIPCGEGYSNVYSLCTNATSEHYNWRQFFDVLEGRMATDTITKTQVLKCALDLIKNEGSIDKAYAYVKKELPTSGLPLWRKTIIRFVKLLDQSGKHRIVIPDEYQFHWYLCTSDTVEKQFRTYNVEDSIDIELYGLRNSMTTPTKVDFKHTKICFTINGAEGKIEKKGNKFETSYPGYTQQMDYDDALKFLNSL